MGGGGAHRGSLWSAERLAVIARPTFSQRTHNCFQTQPLPKVHMPRVGKEHRQRGATSVAAACRSRYITLRRAVKCHGLREREIEGTALYVEKD